MQNWVVPQLFVFPLFFILNFVYIPLKRGIVSVQLGHTIKRRLQSFNLTRKTIHLFVVN